MDSRVKHTCLTSVLYSFSWMYILKNRDTWIDSDLQLVFLSVNIGADSLPKISFTKNYRLRVTTILYYYISNIL